MRRELAERAENIKKKKAEEARLEKEAAARKKEKLKRKKTQGGSSRSSSYRSRPAPAGEDLVASMGLKGTAEESVSTAKEEALHAAFLPTV